MTGTGEADPLSEAYPVSADKNKPRRWDSDHDVTFAPAIINHYT